MLTMFIHILGLFHMLSITELCEVIQLSFSTFYNAGDSLEFDNEHTFLLSKAVWADSDICYVQFMDTNLNLVSVVGVNNRLIHV